MNLDTAIKLLLETGASSTPLLTLSDTTAALVPPNFKVEDLTPLFDKYREVPRRKFAEVFFNTADSFIEYWKLFHSEASRVFAAQAEEEFTAILDYHGVGESPAGWRQHRAHFKLMTTDDWDTWLEHNNKPMSQVQFAEFIEDNLSDIASPPAADMLEASRKLEATKSAQFGQSVRLSNGQIQFKYQEEIKATVGGGTMEVPETFTLRIQAYQGMPKVDAVAKLRFRLNDGKLTMQYILHRPHKIAEQAFESALAQIKDGCGSVLIGRAG